jgi:acyl dehydratase
MPIDPVAALSAPPSTYSLAWTTRDVLLYHLSLGAGARADADPELHYTYEQDLRVLPTFATVAGRGISAGAGRTGAMTLPGIEIDLNRLLHAGQAVTVHRPLPAAGTATVSSRICEVWDKGKAALIVVEAAASDGAGSPLWTGRMQIWARGEGGFGGEPGHETTSARPEREPDLVLDTPTTPGQALLYRLNGDLNPLHADPATATAAGFERPILHGLASYGIVAKALVDALLDSDPARLTGLSVRFAGSLFPGQTIRTRVWRDGDQLWLHSTCPERDDAPVLTQASAVVAA